MLFTLTNHNTFKEKQKQLNFILFLFSRHHSIFHYVYLKKNVEVQIEVFVTIQFFNAIVEKNVLVVKCMSKARKMPLDSVKN